MTRITHVESAHGTGGFTEQTRVNKLSPLLLFFYIIFFSCIKNLKS